MTQAYPLAWPDGWKRTPRGMIEDGKYRFRRTFKSGMRQTEPFWSFSDARDSLLDELRKLGAEEGRSVISSNFPTGRDGFPLVPKSRPDDQGVAVYFVLDARALVMAQDRYVRAEENMRSLALAVEAMRQLDRHGGGVMMERAFSGFAALPPPVVERDWWVVLECKRSDDLTVIKANHRRLAIENHPDRGGDPKRMAEINQARDKALAERALR